MDNSRKDNISLYIHWPFCKSKCPYCDFNSHVAEQIDQQRWLDGYKKELQHYAHKLGKKNIQSIFFGGGTPSLAEPFVIGGILEEASRLFDIAPETEITMEANPTSIEANRFANYKACGVNRVSVGVQSFDANQLKFLGREHSSEEAKKALDIASKTFENFSFDLIYALPNQTLKAWEAELEFALSLGSKHLSLYQLTIEKGTKFFSLHKDKVFTMPSSEESADFYDLTQNIMNKAGLPAYEVSNHAVHGMECKHNLAYWRYDDYIGIGPGAHGRYAFEGRKYATIKLHAPKDWLTKVEQDGVGLQKLEALDDAEVRIEKILMGMRTREGVSLNLINGKIDNLLNEELVEIKGDRLRATSKGILLLNSITEELV